MKSASAFEQRARVLPVQLADETPADLLGARRLALEVVRTVPELLGIHGFHHASNTARALRLPLWEVRELHHPDWVCDNTELSLAIGWEPRIALEEGLRRTLSRPNLADPLSRAVD